MSALACSHDHVLALSYTIVLQFLMPTLPEAQSRCEMHAIHVHDGGIGNTEQLLEMIDNHKKSEDVFFLNDFDLPYINIRARFPKLRRLKARKQQDDDSPDEDPPEEQEEEDEEEEPAAKSGDEEEEPQKKES